VVVGEDVSIFGIDDHSRAYTLEFAPNGFLGQTKKSTKGGILEELAEPRVGEKWCLFYLNVAARRDIDHTRRHVLHQRRQRRNTARLRGKFRRSLGR
jgi:hypothetical protein